MPLFLGADIGGTRSRVWLATERGDVVSRAEGQGANYQAAGTEVARSRMAAVVEAALTQSRAVASDIVAAAFGVAGADRINDYAVVRALLPPLPHAKVTLVNDGVVALRAGTCDGVGVAMVAGTGTNTVGRDGRGREERIGGFGSELGDSGSATDLGRAALGLAVRGRDGRGRPTALSDKLCAALDLRVLEDIVDLWIDHDPRGTNYGRLAPCVFAAAQEGDGVARDLLTAAGEEFALCVHLVLDRLFSREEPVTVVLGGSVLQQGEDSTLVRALCASLSRTHPRARVVRLRVEPVVGGVLLAHDQVENDGNAFAHGLEASVGTAPFFESIDLPIGGEL